MSPACGLYVYFICPVPVQYMSVGCKKRISRCACVCAVTNFLYLTQATGNNGFQSAVMPLLHCMWRPLLFHSSEVPPWSLKEQQVPVSAQTWANAVRTLSTISLKNTHRHGSVTVSKFPQITICLGLRHINRSKKKFKHMYNCMLIHFRSLKYLKFCLV